MSNLSPNFQRESKNKQKEQGWRLFHAKDFHSLMCPCFTICRILGIFPYKINALIFESSKLHYILSIIIICICGINILIELHGFYIYGKSVQMKFLPVAFMYICMCIFGSFITVVTFILSGPRLRLLQAILKISLPLPPKYYQKLSKFIHTKDIIGFLCLVGYWIYVWLEMDEKIYLFKKIYHTYINTVVFQMDMLYVNFVCVLNACFKRINENLAHMREYTANNESHVSRQIYYEQRNSFLIMELKALKKQHLMINNILQMLNIIFSLQLLATVTMTFSEIIINLFMCINIWVQQHNNTIVWTDILKVYQVYLLLHIAYYFTKLILIVWGCETGKNQVLQISTFIYDMFNGTTDEEIKDELQLFSLQILHCKNTFSVKGFGTVDAKFFAGLVGSIATYILILFQFIRMSNSCEGNAANNRSMEIYLE